MSVEVDSPPRRRVTTSRGLVLVLVALTIGALLVLIVVRADSPLPTEAEDTIAAGLEAWFGGDPAAVAEVFEGGSDGVPVSEDQVAYQAAIGAEVLLLDCIPDPTERYYCEIEYSNALNPAVGSPPTILPISFRVDGDSIVQVNTFQNRIPFALDAELESSFANYMVLAGLAVDFSGECHPYTDRGESCARFQRAHIDEWAEWHLAQN